MATRRRLMPAPPEAVWAVLADGWTYPVFVVGTAHMRGVDPGWPAAGALLHHAVGPWPLLVRGTTVSHEAEPPRRLVLTARGWPLGEARVVFELAERRGGTLVSLFEDASAGPGLAMPRPLRAALIALRNGETLQRLEALAVGRWSGGTTPPAPE